MALWNQLKGADMVNGPIDMRKRLDDYRRRIKKLTVLKEDISSVNWHAHVRVDKFSSDQLAWLASKNDLPLSVIENCSGDALRSYFQPDEVTERDGNLLTYSGLAYLLAALTGVTTTTAAVDLANGFLPVAVGDGGGTVPTATVTDSDLTAPSNKWYNPVDASYPAVGAAGSTAGVLTVQSTFTSAVANFAWNEWALYGSTASFTSGQSTKPTSSTMINHKGASLGTKVSGNIWSLSATVTFS
jgi:hypothetical protein